MKTQMTSPSPCIQNQRDTSDIASSRLSGTYKGQSFVIKSGKAPLRSDFRSECTGLLGLGEYKGSTFTGGECSVEAEEFLLGSVRYLQCRLNLIQYF